MSAFLKDIFREIKSTPGRFISLIIITSLGASSIVGIQATSIDMRNIADREYKKYNLYDLQIKSTTGFDEDDTAALSGMEGAAAVMPTYIYDVFVNIEDENKAVRAYALPDGINGIEILEGRLPENSGECVIERRMADDGGIKTGESIKFSLDDMDGFYGVFESDTFTVAGVVSSPLYISFQRGNTTIGDGSLQYYLYLHPSAYKLDVYTDVYMLMDASRGMDNLTDGYYAAADGWKNQAEQTGESRVRAKKDELEKRRGELADAQAQLDGSRERLNDTFKELALSGPRGSSPELDANYEQAYALSDELNEKQAELDQAAEELNNAPEPEWFVFTRKDGIAFDSYYQDTQRLEKIGYVFPLVFFLVAVMVSLTAMSRMVENQRTQIGVYKALGYRPSAILLKYLVYAFGSGVIGGIGGVAFGSRIFPLIISDAYGHLYGMPPVRTPIPTLIAVISVISAVLAVSLVTLATYIGSMSGSPASLMRPKPPAKGKRVLLERLPAIWKRLGFFSKVTARNVFRYKRRFIMTLTGVAGCTALLLTAFGMRGSIGGVAELQYETIVKYDAQAYLKDITSNEQREALDAVLPDESLYVREETVTAGGAGGSLSASIIVPEPPESLNGYINLYSPKTKEPVRMTDRSVLITEKLSRVAGVGVGDAVTVTFGDGRTHTVGVTDVVDNYILHYIYMSPGAYKDAFGAEPEPNGVLIFRENGKDFASPLLENDNARAIVYNDELMARISDSTDALGVVTVVLIVLACALALVVLFNLTYINISERVRELATIKVLGFHDTELAAYIYRENVIVTLLGVALGLAGGVFLFDYVIASVEIDVLKFPKTVHLQSYIISAALSAVFAVFVNLVMSYKLARIDMVESLKNVE